MHQLTDLKPVRKFLSVKLIVFFTFWQGLLIDWLFANTSMFEPLFEGDTVFGTREALAAAVKYFFLCMEMACFAVAHFYVFPPTDYNIVLAARGVFLPSASA